MTGARVGPVDLIYYAPHVLRHVSTLSDIYSIIEDDDAFLASSLTRFLDALDDGRADVPTAFPLVDSIDQNVSGLERDEFFLCEVVGDINAALASTIVHSPSPTEADVVRITPVLDAVVASPKIQVTARQNLLVNFDVGTTLVVDVPIIGRANAQVLQVNATNGELSTTGTSRIAGDGALIKITGVKARDAHRVMQVSAFHAWRRHERSNASTPHDMTTFNEDLYRLLYSPADPDVVYMTSDELHASYLANPERIGNVSELTSIIGQQTSGFFLDRLAFNAGGSIEFPPPMNGLVTGVLTSPRVSIDPIEPDHTIPTVAAVRALIQDAGQLGRSSQAGGQQLNLCNESSLVVPGVLYADADLGVVHISTRLTANNEIACAQLVCEGRLSCGTLECRRVMGSQTSVQAQSVSTRSLSVAEGAVHLDQNIACFRTPVLEAERLLCTDISVRNTLDVGAGLGQLRAGDVHAVSIHTVSNVSCNTVSSVGADISGYLDVGGNVRAASLVVDGMDVVRALQQCMTEIETLRAEVRALRGA